MTKHPPDSMGTMDLTEPVWRRFWHPVGFAEDLSAGPMSRTVLGTRLVLWDAGGGEPAAAVDRCPHRDGPLSQGWTCEGRIVCPYHGWEFAASGKAARVPQLPEMTNFPARFALADVRVTVAYGVLWVCLDAPARPVPALPDAGDGWRSIREFDEEWESAPARLMENSFDPAHTVFVHRGTFGDLDTPDVDVPEVRRTPYGLTMVSDVSVANPDLAQAVTGDDRPKTVRSLECEFHAPFVRVLRSSYPSGIVHQVITAATPVGADRLRLVQWAVRNDTEADSRAAAIVAFDRRVSWEDQTLLEGIAVPYSYDLDANVHIKTDQPTVEVRRIYAEIVDGTWAGFCSSAQQVRRADPAGRLTSSRT